MNRKVVKAILVPILFVLLVSGASFIGWLLANVPEILVGGIVVISMGYVAWYLADDFIDSWQMRKKD